MAAFNKSRDSLANKLPSTESEKGQWLTVDAAYAKGLLGPP
jgi:hypothetical protein